MITKPYLSIRLPFTVTAHMMVASVIAWDVDIPRTRDEWIEISRDAMEQFGYSVVHEAVYRRCNPERRAAIEAACRRLFPELHPDRNNSQK